MQLRYAAAVWASWMLISVGPMLKYLAPGKAAAAIALSAGIVAAALAWLVQSLQRKRQVHGAWLIALFVCMLAGFVWLRPVMLRHMGARRSDREDALRIELKAVGEHRYPYDMRTFLGNAPTPLPGAMLLAVPFYEAGHIGWQNVLWFWAGTAAALIYFRSRATALVFIGGFGLACPVVVNDFLSGGDYITNFVYVTLAVGLVLSWKSSIWRKCAAAALLCGMTLSSRAIYGLMLVPLGFALYGHVGLRRAAQILAMVCASAAAVTLPVFWPAPITRLLEQLGQPMNKLRYMPVWTHAGITLPVSALALAVALAGWRRKQRMDTAGILLVFAVSSGMLLLPPVLTLMWHGRLVPFEMSYLAISVLAIAVWALKRMEELVLAGMGPGCVGGAVVRSVDDA